MKTYDVNWNGLDRGHEGAWSPDVWRDVLNAIAKYSPVNLDDTTGQFYTELATKQPGTQWVTVSPTGDTRTFFRDGREPWASTGVVSFNKGAKTATLTSVGRQVVEGVISYADVLASAALGTEEKGDHPFEIILDAMRRAPSGVGLAYEDVVKVMRHYRSGDDIAEVLNSPNEIISANSGRRLKAILLLMTYAGLAVHKGNLYYAGQDVTALRTLTGMDLREAFKNWIMENNAEGSGKAVSYLTALEDADIIAQAFNEKFKLPSVYEMSDASLESLREFIASEQNLESHTAGSSVLNDVAGLHGKSYWDGGHCGAAISSLLEFKRNLREEKSKSTRPAASQLLTVALKLFAEQRKTVWKVHGWQVNALMRGHFGAMTEAVIRTYQANDVRDFFFGKLSITGSSEQADVMWSGKGNSGWSNIQKALHENAQAVADFLGDLCKDTTVVTKYLQDDFARPQGFGPAVVTELLMKFHPESCFKHGSVTREALTYLGLVDFESEKSDYDEDEYKLVCGAAALILARMKAMKLSRQINVDGFEDKAKPDYLTVNEFIWFVNEHLNEIENEVVEKKMEPAKHIALPDAEKNKKPVVNMEDSDDVLLLRLRAALRTKPFAILAGHSGTGKSRMVRKLAYMTCNDEALRYVLDDNGNVKTDAGNNPIPLKEPGNFCMIQVKPNWHDSCDLLGYYSELGKRYRASEFVKFICKAYAYPKTPFFVCLDEMNLAPVEQYFAEYLSAIESRKLQGDVMTTDELVPKTAYVIKDETGEAFHADWVGCETPEAEYWLKKYGLTIPRNLFVVGTVNMDESTNQFSRKVLDRAMTIEMTDADFDSFGHKGTELSFKDYMGDAAVADLLAGKVQATELLDDQKKNLNALKAVLASTSFAVAYRFANEYALYEEALKSTYKPASVEGTDPTDQIDLSALTSEVESGSAASVDEGDGSGATAEGSAAVSASAKKPAIPSAFDDMVLMKVLPRISGDETDVKRIFYEGPSPEKLSPRPSETAPAENTLLKLLGPKKDTASVRKIKWILARGGSYLSFWP